MLGRSRKRKAGAADEVFRNHNPMMSSEGLVRQNRNAPPGKSGWRKAVSRIAGPFRRIPTPIAAIL